MIKNYELKKLKAANIDNIFGSMALLDALKNKKFEDLLQKCSGSCNGESKDEILYSMLQEFGFTALPIKVSCDKYNLLLKSNFTEIYRGVKINNGQLDYSTNPNMFLGHGIYLNGIYFMYGKFALKEALMFSKPPNIFGEQKKEKVLEISNGEVIKCVLSSEAKVIDMNDLINLNQSFINATKEHKVISNSTKKKLIALFSQDMAKSAVLSGCDAVRISELNYMVVLNRSKTIVEEQTLKK